MFCSCDNLGSLNGSGGDDIENDVGTSPLSELILGMDNFLWYLYLYGGGFLGSLDQNVLWLLTGEYFGL